jgi:hypothetical protein
MPDQIAPSMDSIRNIRLTDNGDGTFSLGTGGGGGAAATAGIAMLAFDVNTASYPEGASLADFGFTAPQIAAATKARVSCYSGEAAYAYIDTAFAGVSLAHPLAAGETVIIEGAANVAGLVIYASISASMIITLEGPAT